VIDWTSVFWAAVHESFSHNRFAGPSFALAAVAGGAVVLAGASTSAPASPREKIVAVSSDMRSSSRPVVIVGRVCSMSLGRLVDRRAGVSLP
jgi:hypothetical protein